MERMWSNPPRRPRPVQARRQRDQFGIESGPWIGRVPDGWRLTELARMRTGKDGRGSDLALREGSLLVYPSGLVWLDHIALGSVTLGRISSVPDLAVMQAEMPSRFERRVLATVYIGDWRFDMGKKAATRVQDAINDARRSGLSAVEETAQYRYLGLCLLCPTLYGLPDWKRFIRLPFGSMRGFFSGDPLKGGEPVSAVQLTQIGLGLYDERGLVMGVASWDDVSQVERRGDAVNLIIGTTYLTLHSEKDEALEAFIKEKRNEMSKER